MPRPLRELVERALPVTYGAELLVRFVSGEEFVAQPEPQAEPLAVDADGGTALAARRGRR